MLRRLKVVLSVEYISSYNQPLELDLTKFYSFIIQNVKLQGLIINLLFSHDVNLLKKFIKCLIILHYIQAKKLVDAPFFIKPELTLGNLFKELVNIFWKILGYK